ncbi:MAG: hypothetical protein GF332_02765 [Candidatus Moranbacteria bacterium]|nr:hypothetical protein [Candidatus Moranbacteria bacterium]
MVGFIGFLISLAPIGTQKGLDYFWEYNIKKAKKILDHEGENQFGFEKVQDMWFLKQSFINQYKDKGRLYSLNKKELFSKIYDDTLENNLKGKLNIADFESSIINATTSLSKDENAAVLLTFAEYDSIFHDNVNVIKTVVTYEFQNRNENNQEVIFKIRLPKTQSVVTDLKLGLNLEKQGIVAPRGAAEQVYQESLVKNIDPALITQIGVREYKLRVFPVTSKRNNKTQGRQKVQFTYLTPIDSDDEIVLAPKIETLNLTIEEKTKAIVRLRKDDKRIIKESVIKENKEEFFSTPKIYEQDLEVADRQFCMTMLDDEEHLKEYKHTLDKEEKNSEAVIFFDISRSAGEKEDINKIYEEIYNTFQDEALPSEAYFYNFSVYPSVAEFNDDQFFGYTDTVKVIKYLNENKFSGKDILIVGDDINFEFTKKENKDINYKELASNTISMIQVGSGIRAHKDEITKAVLASGGKVVIVNNLSDVTKNRINSLKQDSARLIFDNCIDIAGMNNEDLIRQIQVHSLTNLLLANINNETTWKGIGQLSAELAKKYRFVNLFSSFIALETTRQAYDLEKYSRGSGRFDVNYLNEDYQESSYSISSAWSQSMAKVENTSLTGKDSYSIGKRIFDLGTLKNIGIITTGIVIVMIGLKWKKKKSKNSKVKNNGQ